MLYKIWCNPVHPIHCALSVPYVPLPVTHFALVAQRNTYTYLHNDILWLHTDRTSQYHSTFILFSLPLLNDLADPVFDGVGLAGFTRRGIVFLLS